MTKIRAVAAAIILAVLGVVLVTTTSSIATASPTDRDVSHVTVISHRTHHPRPPKPPAPGDGGTGTTTVKITFYGAYDNSPPGSTEISHPVLHQTAGGTGTSQDPMTFASPSGQGAYPWGQRIYVPSVQKYFIKEDNCTYSWTDNWGCGPITHLDLYIGNPSGDKAVLNCEDALTPDGGGPIVLNPVATLKYDPTPMWKQSTRTCMKLH